ncbi:ABC transporter ATP-binding protein [Listeria sp. PSOL-1]|uniref:ATP-binding cassette domain-containing protein n=1 Tax=Listeria sp. PSOL-1 TaxID=1844999 RepID=UPI0013D4164B|nr:ABC transporter ATP-binding protein [Listeria sp. PSOL-1]
MKTFLKEYKTVTLITILCRAVASILKVFTAFFSADMLNSLVEKEYDQFLIYTGLSLLFWLLFAVFYYLYQYLAGVASQKMIQSMRMKISRNIAHANIDKIHKTNTGKLVSWITNDMTIIENQSLSQLFLVSAIVLDTMFSLIALFSYHWSLILCITFFSIFTVFLPQVLSRKLKRKNNEVVNNYEQLNKKASDLFHGFDLLFFFNRTSFIEKEMQMLSEKMKTAKIRLTATQGQITALSTLSNVFSQILTMAWAGWLSYSGITSIGSVIAINSLGKNIYDGLMRLAPALADIYSIFPIYSKHARLSCDEVNNFSRKKFLELPSTKEVPIIEATDITCKIHDRQLFLPATFKLFQGQKLALIGPSGIGKSTLLQMMIGGVEADQGKFFYCGEDISKIETATLRKHILYFNQHPYIFEDTIRMNLTLGDDYSDQVIWDALKKTKMEEVISALPKGLDSYLGKMGKSLSGGQLQRLALARALIREYDVILLDESTNSLDKELAIEIETELLSNRKITLVMVTHQVHTENIGLFDRVYELLPAVPPSKKA